VGYYVRIFPRKVRVPADQVDACLAAVNQLLAEDAPDWIKRERELRCYDNRTGTVIPGFFSWLRGPKPPATGWGSLLEAFRDWRFEATQTFTGGGSANDGVTLGQFLGEKIGDEEVLWRAIAPFVVSGGRIDMYGEDDNRWRYVFQDGAVKLFFRKNDTWEKMLFLVDEKSTQDLIKLRRGEPPSEEDVDAARFQKIEDGFSAEGEDEKVVPDEVDGKRFRIMMGNEPLAVMPQEASSLILPASDLSTLARPSRRDSVAPSPIIVRLLGVRSRGVQ